jgi:hypothetical protein
MPGILINFLLWQKTGVSCGPLRSPQGLVLARPFCFVGLSQGRFWLHRVIRRRSCRARFEGYTFTFLLRTSPPQKKNRAGIRNKSALRGQFSEGLPLSGDARFFRSQLATKKIQKKQIAEINPWKISRIKTLLQKLVPRSWNNNFLDPNWDLRAFQA